MTVEHNILRAVFDNGGQIDRDDLSKATDLSYELIDPRVDELVKKKCLKYLKGKKSRKKGILGGGWMMVEITSLGKSVFGE